MSDQVVVVPPAVVSEIPEVDGVVSRKAYAEVAADMHRFKQAAKEAAEELARIKADREAAENASLVENNKWKELYEKTEKKAADERASLAAERESLNASRKKAAVLAAIGGFKKSDYETFIQLSAVAMGEDGQVDSESLKVEAARIQASYPELLSPRVGSPALPNRPAAQPPLPKARGISQLSAFELAKLATSKK